MNKTMTTLALAVLSIAFGYVLTLQSWDVFDQLTEGTFTFGLEIAFTLLLASIGVWSLTQKAARTIGARRAGAIVMGGAATGMVLVGIVPPF